jgi:hypothetical protein
MKSILIAVVLLLSAASPSRAAEPTRAEQVRAALKNPNKKLKSYAFNPDSSLESRVGPAPTFLVETLKKWDNKKDYEPYTPTSEENALLRAWLAALPAKMREAFRKRLIGMFFVKNLVGNGLTDFALDEKGNIYPLIVFNPVGFGRTLSQTLTLRDASAFKGDAEILVNCGEGERGMQYTVLHEGTHAYDFIRGVTPYVDDVEVYATRGGKGLDASWDVWASDSRPKPQWDYPARHKIHFYGLSGGPELDANEASAVYAQLAASPFVSLYGSQSWAEDVAELFTFYHLTRALKRECEVRVTNSAEPFQFEPMKKGTKAWERADRLFGSLYDGK